MAIPPKPDVSGANPRSPAAPDDLFSALLQNRLVVPMQQDLKISPGMVATDFFNTADINNNYTPMVTYTAHGIDGSHQAHDLEIARHLTEFGLHPADGRRYQIAVDDTGGGLTSRGRIVKREVSDFRLFSIYDTEVTPFDPVTMRAPLDLVDTEAYGEPGDGTLQPVAAHLRDGGHRVEQHYTGLLGLMWTESLTRDWAVSSAGLRPIARRSAARLTGRGPVRRSRLIRSDRACFGILRVRSVLQDFPAARHNEATRGIARLHISGAFIDEHPYYQAIQSSDIARRFERAAPRFQTAVGAPLDGGQQVGGFPGFQTIDIAGVILGRVINGQANSGTAKVRMSSYQSPDGHNPVLRMILR